MQWYPNRMNQIACDRLLAQLIASRNRGVLIVWSDIDNFGEIFYEIRSILNDRDTCKHYYLF
jgi:hypothetical protein